MRQRKVRREVRDCLGILGRVDEFEQGIGPIKRFKRVMLRCEKTARNFRSIVSFAAGLCLIKFVHTV